MSTAESAPTDRVRSTIRRRSLGCVGLGLVLALAWTSPATAEEPGVIVDATVDGVDVRGTSDSAPAVLHPVREATVHVRVHNRTRNAINVDAVRLEGRVIGLTFFAYDTAVGMTVPAGESDERTFRLDLRTLDGQATGLVRGSIALLGSEREVVASTGVVWDVRGDLTSVYALFGLGVAMLSATSVIGAVVGMARHRLHPNRWWRAVRFLTPGVGVGLTFVFLLSALRVLSARPSSWIPIVAIGAAAGLVTGFFTPAPDDPDDVIDDAIDDGRLAGDADPNPESLVLDVTTPATGAQDAASARVLPGTVR